MTPPLIVAVSLLAAAAVADVVAHAFGLTTLQTPAHVATLVAMVATLAAAVADGLAKHRHIRRHKERTNAIR